MNRSTAAPDTPSPPLLAIRLRPSLRLSAMLTLAHLAAIGLLWPLALPVAARLAGSLLLLAGLGFHLRRHALLRSPVSVTGLAFSHEMTCTLEQRDGRRVACSVLGSTFVASYLTVLELQPIAPESGRPGGFSALRALPATLFSGRSVTILPDGIDTEAFRQLRVLLRWKWRGPAP